MQFFQIMLKWHGQQNLLNYVRVQSIVPVELDVSLHILYLVTQKSQRNILIPSGALLATFLGKILYTG